MRQNGGKETKRERGVRERERGGMDGYVGEDERWGRMERKEGRGDKRQSHSTEGTA